jgi:(E)-4-hydroxy-3-methylbut-2-enyl-diphosphate synthase
MKRKKTREVKIGKIFIGGENPIRVQSMTSTRTEDIKSTLEQIEKLIEEECEIIRIAIPNREALKAFAKIRREVDVPLVADIHFNYRLAVEAADMGADKIRINPGNIGDKRKVKEVIEAARTNGIPIRIGVNSGSLEMDLIDKYGGVTSNALVESALRWIKFFEEENFQNLVISVKSASVSQTIESYRLLSSKTDYPLHIGVTEAGPPPLGSIKSSIGIGTLLAEGIGDTIRVSLTADPVEEVRVAWDILKSLELRSKGVMLISCPTCGRTRVDLFSIVRRVEEGVRNIKFPIKVAVMGCEVNGPGEAKEADVGVAASPGFGLIFRKGKVIRKVPEGEIVEALLEEIKLLEKERERNGKV